MPTEPNIAAGKGDGVSPRLVAVCKFILGPVFRALWGLQFHGLENIPQTRAGGLLIAPNHQTYLDPFWISLPIKRRQRFMAWDKATEWFLIGGFIKRLGAFPVDVVHGGKDSYRKALEVLRAGDTLMVFPEGAREFADGRLLPFKTGAARIAVEAEVPILPVTVSGGHKVWPRGQKYPRPGRVWIHYHPIIEVKPVPDSQAKQYAREITEQLAKTIGAAAPKDKTES